MIGNAELTEELVRLLDEYPREARDNRFSSTLRGEMAVMRLLHNSRQKMTAGELSSRLDMTTSRIAAVLGSLQKKGLLERESDEEDRRRVMVSLTEAGDRLCEKRKRHFMSKISKMLAILGEDAPTFVHLLGRVFEITSSPEFRQDDCIEEDRIETGIAREREMISFIRDSADYIIDTTTLLTRELRQEVEKIFVGT